MTLLPPRPVRYALAWVGAAAVAVAVGLLALQLLGGDIGPSIAAGVTTSSTPPASTSTAAPATSPSGLYRTPGGTVYATCSDPGSQPVVNVVVNPGWGATTSRGDTEARIEGGGTEYRIVVTCNASGVPVFTPTTDDRDGSGSGGPGSPAATATPSGGDDHGGGTSGRPTSGASSGGHGGSGAPTASPTRTSGGEGGGGGGGGHGGGDDSSPHG